MRLLFKLALILACAVLGASHASAADRKDAVHVTQQDISIPLIPRKIVMDPQGELSPDEALQRLSEPGAIEEDAVYSLGYIPETLWARIALDVTPDAAGRWYLSLELPNFDRLQVDILTSSGHLEPLTELGDMVPDQSPFRSRFHIAPIDLPPGQTVLLVKGKTSSTMTLDLKLRKLDWLLSEERLFLALQTFYFGVIAVLTLSAIGLFGVTRESIYLIYIANLVAHTGVWAILAGSGPGYLWPNTPLHHPSVGHFFVAMTLTTTFAFAAAFLATSQVPKLAHWIFWGMSASGVLLMAVCLAVPTDLGYWANRLVSAVVLPCACAIGALTIVGMVRGVAGARPLMLTWLGILIVVPIGWLRDIGLVPTNVFTLTVSQLASVFEMIMFAYLLLQRLGRIQKDKDRIQHEALTAAREHEALLEHRVAARTADLDAAVIREREAQRLQQQFVVMVGHEFRNPLAIIDNMIQNLARGAPASRGRLDRGRAAVRRLRRMIDTCLIDERIRGGQMQLRKERLEAGKLVGEVIATIRAAHATRQFELDLPEGPLLMTVDPRLIEIAVSNVIDNAAKYSPETSPVETHVHAAGSQIEIEVMDRGPGVPETDRERVFERYYRGSRSGSGGTGAGLGLFLVRAILSAHGGTITYADRPGGGAAFTLRLPLDPDTEGT
ncbi:ATP-binding protein [Nisaea acidiphila]|uniref:histidine kinase n=1 Tax=Nisaea acidiphila TaxID=1862145 RepID=A0A9J7AQL5_9PROT|nr:ATP-binding protein [Nisaea acidiphila]UUX48889.1 ATP-binding protein [Nisaea acidiphila]